MLFQALMAQEKSVGLQKNQGKRGGVRVIYFNVSEQGVIYLITLYQKSVKENISTNEIFKKV
jgi:hypothetical protein